MILLGPLAGELPPHAGTWFSGGLVEAVAQGWLRSWDEWGRVSTAACGAKLNLSSVNVIVASEREVLPADVETWTGDALIVVITRGALGVRMHYEGAWRCLPGMSAREVDPTGAGDVWAAAFLVRLDETGDAVEAAEFACDAAALSVEAPGLAGVPSRSEIEPRRAAPT